MNIDIKIKNRVEFTGTIERLQRIETKTGKPMAKWLLKVDDSRFICLAFGNLAEAILERSEGESVNITGTGKINSWKTSDDIWRNDFQVTVWEFEINDQVVQYQKNKSGEQEGTQGGTNEHDYQGGPF